MLNTIQNSNNYFVNTVKPSITFNSLKNLKELPGIKNLKLPSLTTSNSSSSSSSSSSLNPNLKEAIEDGLSIIEPTLSNLGVKWADQNNMTGMEKAMGTVGQTALKAGLSTGFAPLAIAGGVVTGLDWINRAGGSDLDKVEMMATGPYAFNLNTASGTKGTIWSRITGKDRKKNKAIDRDNTSNLLSYSNVWNMGNVDKILSNTLGTTYQRNQNTLWGDLNTRAISAKKGGTIHRNKLEYIIRDAKNNIKSFKDGGKLEDPNIIPDGAFHSRKNNLPEDIAKDVTPKGIPVIIKDGDKITQIAEIEKGEIVFNKEVSEKIENYLKEYDKAETQKEKDKIAIQCGKLISDQIINNTVDNVGLLNKE